MRVLLIMLFSNNQRSEVRLLYVGMREGSVHTRVMIYVVQQMSEKRGVVVGCGDKRRQCAYVCY
jgi:hypothetical protein